MAIKRCPYCKAIIDEGSGFCSNCGTQLLFPEDESIEEEVPGDKIVDEEELPSGHPEEIETEEEKIKSVDRDEGKTLDSEEKEKEEIERFLESVKRERARKAQTFAQEILPSPEDKKEEAAVSLEEEVAGEKPEEKEKDEEEQEKEAEFQGEEERIEPKKESLPQSKDLYFKTEELDKIPEAKTKEREEIEKYLASIREGRAEEASSPAPEELSSPPETEEEEIRGKLGRITPEEQPEKLDTDEKLFIKMEIDEGLERAKRGGGLFPEREEIKEEEETPSQIEKMTLKSREEPPDVEEKEKDEIEKFLESIKKERAEKAEKPAEEIPPSSEGMEEQVSETEQELPPWAERMKKGAPQEFEAEGEEEGKAGHLEIGEDFQEEEKEKEEKQGKEAEEEVEELEEAEEEEGGEELEEAEEETLEEEFPIPAKEVELDERKAQVRIPFQERIEEEAEEAAEERVQPPSRLSIWLKSRAFDFLSIAVLWAISLWLASRLVQVGLFKLILNSTLQVLGFYLVLLVLYFSFFIILLGETLGDLIFSKEG